MKQTTISSQDDLDEVISAFSQGKIVCIPTDTVYAISCDATNIDAIKKIYQIKKRVLNKTLPIFVADVEMAKAYVKFSSKELRLIENFWPGALTLVSKVLDNNQKIPNILINKDKIAVRTPDHKLIRSICKRIDKPIIATSANISSQSSINSTEDVIKIFLNKVDYIVKDSASCKSNDLTPSTIIEFIKEDKLRLIREGKISKNALDNGI
jgi:L-threonylcarbamoyladenylate synthase